MVKLTHAAATQIEAARAAQDLPDSFGLRVFGERQPGGDMALGLAFAEVPAEDDQVGEQQGTRLFVAPEVAAPLETKVIDMMPTAEGDRLVVRDQEPGAEA